MALSATATPSSLSSLEAALSYPTAPVVVKSSVNRPNIFLEAKSIQGFVKSHRGKKAYLMELCLLHI